MNKPTNTQAPMNPRLAWLAEQPEWSELGTLERMLLARMALADND